MLSPKQGFIFVCGISTKDECFQKMLFGTTLSYKNKALKVLRARLLDKITTEQNEKRSQERKSQVGSGDRSGRIRTYNFPQGRVTDHRIGLTLYKLDNILQGDIDEILQELATFYQSQALQNAEADSPQGA